MNDAHRAMEGPAHAPLDSMARLTWWTLDSGRGVYRNVISGREIPVAQWSPKFHDTSIACLVGNDCHSFTRAFYNSAAAPQGPPVPKATAIADVNTKFSTMSLASNNAQSPSRPPTAMPAPNQSPSRPPTAMPAQNQPSRAPAAVMPDAALPGAASAPGKRFQIENKVYAASYHKDTGKWVVKYMGEERPIIKFGRKYVVVYNGTRVEAVEKK